MKKASCVTLINDLASLDLGSRLLRNALLPIHVWIWDSQYYGRPLVASGTFDARKNSSEIWWISILALPWHNRLFIVPRILQNEAPSRVPLGLQAKRDDDLGVNHPRILAKLVPHEAESLYVKEVKEAEENNKRKVVTSKIKRNTRSSKPKGWWGTPPWKYCFYYERYFIYSQRKWDWIFERRRKEV